MPTYILPGPCPCNCGSGSGSGSGSGTRLCCADEITDSSGIFPSTLYGTFSGSTCLSTLAFNGSNAYSQLGTGEDCLWTSDSFQVCGMTTPNQLQLYCKADGSGWALQPVTSCDNVTTHCCFTSPYSIIEADSVTCNPFTLVFTLGVDSSCGGPATLTLTITR